MYDSMPIQFDAACVPVHICVGINTHRLIAYVQLTSYPYMCSYIGTPNDSTTPFYIACQRGEVAVLDWLVSHGLPSSEMTRESMCIYRYGLQGGMNTCMFCIV